MPTYEDERGYIRHSNLVSRGKAKEQIWEKNRDKYPLPFTEYVVHHKDGDKKNNKIENLQLMTPKEHNELHKAKMKTKKINWIFESRIGKGILFIFVGLILIFGKQDVITTKSIGILIVIFSILFLVGEIHLYYKVKKSKKYNEIKNSAHSIIANYFERNSIKYIYMPKDEKDFEFLLPEYDVYVKYWEEHPAKAEREKIKKRVRKYELKFVEIFYDKIHSHKILHASFMKRLSKQLKKR